MSRTKSEKNPYDVTNELRAAERLLTVHRGLYVQYLKNRSRNPVYDRNGEARGGGALLIPGRGTTIKIGKFEGGFLARRAQDAIHLHHRPAAVMDPPQPHNEEFVYEPALATYMNCLVRIYLLDLGSPARAVVREAERELRQEMNAFLRGKDLPVQSFRGDWRLLIGRVPADLLENVDEWVRSAFKTLSNG